MDEKTSSLIKEYPPMNVMKIFLFHRVSPERDPLWDPIAPEKFDSIIRFLSKNYQVVQLEQTILDGRPAKTSKPLAAIVFDDGYKDFLLHALPILKKYACPCSMYVITDCVETQRPPWTYILDYHFIYSKKLQLNLDSNLLPDSLKQFNISDDRSRIAFAKQLKPFLKTVPNNVRIHLCNQVLASLNDVQPPTDLMMNWKELKEIKNEGVEIGSHTKSHPLLNKLDQESEIICELKESGALIASHLGSFPFTISYPIGGYNASVKKLAAQSGYKMGLAVNQQPYTIQMQDIFEIPRMELYNESMFKTRLRISGMVSRINKFRKK
jgi:peptidoglycan/xylan/chitin deacetylase (PgdA/CDA1 family)